MSLDGAATDIEAIRAQVTQAAQDANITRYISAVGLVLLLYDHMLTFKDEISLVWTARPSFAKKVFLLNRYVVPTTQIICAVFMNHFSGDALSDESCKLVLSTSFVIGVCSVACGNVLVILRVIALWDRDIRIIRVIALGFCISYTATLVFMVLILRDSYPGIAYISFVHTCLSTNNSPVLPGIWASLLVFEVVVLSLVMYNALSRPRSRTTPLRRVLYRDGIQFFTCLSSLRTANLIISIAARPSLMMSGVFAVWAMTTLVLSRSLFDIHKASYESKHTRLPSRGTYSNSIVVDRSSLTLTGTGASGDTRPARTSSQLFHPDMIEEYQDLTPRSFEMMDQKTKFDTAGEGGGKGHQPAC